MTKQDKQKEIKPRKNSKIDEVRTQGKALDKEKTMALLEPYLSKGLSVTKACEMAGLEQSTIHRWLNKDKDLSREVRAMQNIPTLKALEHKVKAIEKGEMTSVDFWLTKKKGIKDEFTESVRVEADDKLLDAIDKINKIIPD
jgi:hypothetical protein